MNKTRKLTGIAILSALAAILMYFKFAIPIFPSFYKIDFSNTIILLGGFVYGPVGCIIISIVKCLLKLLLTSSNSMLIGDLADLLTHLTLCLTASIIYKKTKNTKGAITGMVLGLIIMTVVGCLFNYYVLIPAYATVYKMPVDAIISMGTQLNNSINSLFSFVVLITLPFNLVKGLSNIIVSYIIYLSTKKVVFKQID